LIPDKRGDTFAEEGVIVHCEDADHLNIRKRERLGVP
jgi:hypothetical protein